MTAPAPLGRNVVNNHIAKRAPSRHDNTGWLKADAFHVGSRAADAEDRIIYDAAKGALYYDTDGAGGNAQVQFAKLDKHLSLTINDFKIF